ncbi:hypothetical protein V492_01442 [Pseudogymnoascus sp. VKM F-4246]|nr:hypothetical protein V492_01442 [Pseudogymnoascus sp. VKM F-4246]
MINNSRLEYIFIRTCILFLHYLTPVSITYTVFLIASYGLGIPRPHIPLVINVIAVAESLFYLVVFLPYSTYLQRAAVHPPVPSRPERKALFEKCYKFIPDPETYLDRWFLGAPQEEIKRENVKEFIQWAFFNRGGEAGDDDEELEEYVTAYETLVGRKFEPGRGDAECLRLTLDPIDMLHRSLVWYMCVGFVDFLTYIGLRRAGFYFHRTSLSRFFTLFPFRPQTVLTTKRSPAKYTTYWHRPHTSTTHLPVLFIHGIGIGLYPYVSFLSEINNSAEDIPSEDGSGGQIGVIALEIHPVSFRLTHAPLAPAVLCAEIASILNHHGYSRVVLATHSYGSVIATHLLAHTETAPMIADMVLIDPVTILLHLPDVAYNFTRRPPQSASEHQLWYFASMDMGVAHSLARHFFWSENVLWKEDLEGRDVTVSLAGRDLIVNTQAVGQYLADGSEDADEEGDEEVPEMSEDGDLLVQEGWKHRTWRGKGLDILWFDNLDHAQVFDTPTTRRPVLKAIRAYAASGL